MEINIKGYVVLIDEDDYERISSLGTWRVVNNKGYLYVVRSVWDKNKGYTTKRYLHREIMNNPEGKLVDHKNRNTLDNRKENLRIATKQQNQCNRKTQSSSKYSKYKGVTCRSNYKGTKKWLARIKKDGEEFTESFYSEKEAALWYNEKAKELHGDFAFLNDVGD